MDTTPPPQPTPDAFCGSWQAADVKGKSRRERRGWERHEAGRETEWRKVEKE